MKVRLFTAALVMLAATAVWSQSISSSATPPTRRKTVVATTSAESATAVAKSQAAMNQRVQEMGNTLAKMHALVKQMRTKTAGGGNDPVAKANVDLWELMVGQLDQQFEQLRAAARTRQDMESRRNAMYKQAEERAAAAARNAQQAASGATTSQSSVPVAASQQPASSTAAQTTPASSTPSTSPN